MTAAEVFLTACKKACYLPLYNHRLYSQAIYYLWYNHFSLFSLCNLPTLSLTIYDLWHLVTPLKGWVGCRIVTRPLFLLVRGGVWARDYALVSVSSESSCNFSASEESRIPTTILSRIISSCRFPYPQYSASP